MITFGFPTLSGLVLGLTLFTSSSLSHKIDSRFADVSPVYETFHDSVYARGPEENETFSEAVFSRTRLELARRGLYNFGTNSAADTSILQQGFLDMVDVVTHNAHNPDAAIMARYFAPGDAATVTAVFNTVLQMAGAGGYPNAPTFPQGRLQPQDLSEISVVHAGDFQLGALAESFGTGPFAANAGPQIKVYNFGWGGLWQRLRSSLVRPPILKLHIWSNNMK